MARKDTKKSQIIAETQQIIKQYTTRLTVRQIYYRLVSKHIIPNLQNQYKYLVKTLVEARWDHKIPFKSIEDRTRQFIGGDEPLTNPKDHFDQWFNAFQVCASLYKLPHWLDQEVYIEVWLEKQALQGLFQQVTDEWHVTLFPCRGYPSLTKLYESAVRIKAESEDKPIRILYFGDYDPSGEDIIRSIEDNLTRFGIDFKIEKIAILEEQIEEYKIPPMPAKTSDPRYARFVEEHGEDAVELDAIDPDNLQTILKDSISKEFDSSTREAVEERLEEEQEEIQTLVDGALKKSKRGK